MSDTSLDSKSILESAKFKHLVERRNRARFILTALSLVVYSFFVGGIAFYKEWFAEPLVDTGSIPLGILVTVVTIITMIFLEWIYVWYSQRVLDPAQAEVKQEFENHE